MSAPVAEGGGDGRAACRLAADDSGRGASSSSPTPVSSRKPRASFVYSEPEASGATTTSGARQPSCWAISKAMVLEPSA